VKLGFLRGQPWIAVASLCCATIYHALALVAGSPAQAKSTNLGVALSPAHIPFQIGADIDRFFEEAGRIGGHVTWIIEWQSMPPITQIRAVREQTRRHGLGFQLYLSPIALTGGRRTPAIPSAVGESSFRAQAVREAFTKQALELAALRPDVLGLATEVNFLAANPDEFGAFVSLAREAYSAVKRYNPDQVVTVSFQWDVVAAHTQIGLLAKFANALDVYSFTTYPDAFGPHPALPGADYYSAIRKILPTQRVGFAEIGWSSAYPSSADQQAKFYGSIPRLFGALKADYLTLALMHDVPIFTGDLARLNFVGIRTLDDQPKPAWNAVLNLPELH
jgi:hypothetical protein